MKDIYHMPLRYRNKEQEAYHAKCNIEQTTSVVCPKGKQHPVRMEFIVAEPFGSF
ncbi:hypothetical protein J7L68_05440 [bacterium]|nr:hypothetical protein [bacterium]